MTLIETNGKLSALKACNAKPIKVGERRKRLLAQLYQLLSDSLIEEQQLTDFQNLAPAQYEPQTEQSPPEPRI